MYLETTATRKLLTLKKRIRGISGGTSASKTVSIILILVDYAQKNDHKVVSIVSESMPHLRKGAMRDFLNIMKEHQYFKDDRWNKTESTYTFEGGTIIEFFGVESWEKVKGARRDVLFINEANHITYETYTQLEVRTKGIIWLDWNPEAEFWWYSEVMPKYDVDFITLTYKDNEGLDENIIRAIEARKSNRAWWQVYGLGQLGVVEGRIYRDWQIIDEIPHQAQLKRYGLDFGYCVDGHTEIFTKEGWKTYHQLRMDDKVMTLNKETGKSEWQSLKNIHRFDGKFEMWSIEGQSHSSFSTGNHRWLVEARPESITRDRKFKTTENLKVTDRILCSADCSNLPKKKKFSDSFVELVAWFWTEGQITKGGISIWQNEGEHSQRIRQALKDYFGL